MGAVAVIGGGGDGELDDPGGEDAGQRPGLRRLVPAAKLLQEAGAAGIPAFGPGSAVTSRQATRSRSTGRS